MSEAADSHRFYGDLARWWPLLSPPEDYREEAGYLATLLASASIPVSTVLELGSGGGHNAVHLKDRFTMTLVDLSAEMLAVSQELNPECEHQQGDMRSYRTGRLFDAVLIHDAVDYMTSEDDLRLAVRTAYEHCRPGGVAVFMPDDVTERFTESTDCGGTDLGADEPGVRGSATRAQAGAAGPSRGARYLSWTWDPDPGDEWVLTEYAFLLREDDGVVRVVHETHRTGLFSTAVWSRILQDAGFRADAVDEETTEDRRPRLVFVAHRPS